MLAYSIFYAKLDCRLWSGVSVKRHVWFCMPETFWRGREGETVCRAATGGGAGDKVSKLSGKLCGAICSRQSSAHSVGPSLTQSPTWFRGFRGQGNSLERSRKRKILSGREEPGPFSLRVEPSPSCAIFTSNLKLEPLWDFSCCAYLLAAFLHDISEPKDGRRAADGRESFKAPGNRRVLVECEAGLTPSRLG